LDHGQLNDDGKKPLKRRIQTPNKKRALSRQLSIKILDIGPPTDNTEN
jgi:hypothetical protein